jgi:hypothetical protein
MEMSPDPYFTDVKMEKMLGYDKLTDEQKVLFIKVHSRHLSSMGTAKRQAYSIGHLKKIKWDNIARCLKVYFKDGDWWHYDTKGCWF